MIKNIVLDIGGVLVDDSKQNLSRVLKKSMAEVSFLSKICYSGSFKDCLLGKITMEEHKQMLMKKYPELQVEIDLILSKENFFNVLPVIKDTVEYVLSLKQLGYHIYFLSNLTEETYGYLEEILNQFDGGISSFRVHLIKPDEKIYNRLIRQYDLNRKETIFFDDRVKNVEMGNRFGIKSFVYKNKYDILNVLKRDKECN